MHILQLARRHLYRGGCSRTTRQRRDTLRGHGETNVSICFSFVHFYTVCLIISYQKSLSLYLFPYCQASNYTNSLHVFPCSRCGSGVLQFVDMSHLDSHTILYISFTFVPAVTLMSRLLVLPHGSLIYVLCCRLSLSMFRLGCMYMPKPVEHNIMRCRIAVHLLRECAKLLTRMLYPSHTGGAVPLRCLYGINRSGNAMIAVVPRWFRHGSS